MVDEVVIFCQTKIRESGLVLDEDLVFIQMVKLRVKEPDNAVIRRIIFLASGACTTLWALKKRDNVKVASTGILFLSPIAISFLFSIFRKKKSQKRQNCIVQLLSKFRNLSKIHSEVTDFLKSFSSSVGATSNPLLQISQETIYDLSKCTCDAQVLITNEMIKVIREIHMGLQDVFLDLSEFEKATAFPLLHDSLLGCIHNANFIEGQVVLLRSHLLTSLFMVSTYQNAFIKVVDNIIPPMINLLDRSIQEIKSALQKTRFPDVLPTLSLAKMDGIFAQKKMVSVPKLKRHVIKINDGICCTLMKSRVLLGTLENVESESQMALLQEAVSTLTQELFLCYVGSSDLEKLLTLLNRNSRSEDQASKTFIVQPKEANDSGSNSIDKFVTVTEEPQDSSDYQVFANEISDDDNESHAVRFYKRFMNNDVDWLAELKQSDEFQRRQNKFHTGPLITSTPLDLGNQDEGKLYKTALELQFAPSVDMLESTPPPPPPPPAPFPADISDIMAGLSVIPESPPSKSSGEISSYATLKIPQAQPLEPLTTVESSLLLDSLKEVLGKMGSREEDEFE